MVDTKRMFPIQGHTIRKRKPNHEIDCLGAFEIPWEIAEVAYRAYSRRYGTQQSLERLAERHGFGMFELAVLLQEEYEHDTGVKR